jgi:hypothetical protein
MTEPRLAFAAVVVAAIGVVATIAVAFVPVAIRLLETFT